MSNSRLFCATVVAATLSLATAIRFFAGQMVLLEGWQAVALVGCGFIALLGDRDIKK